MAMKLIDWTKHDLYFVTNRFDTAGLTTSTQTRYWIEDELDLGSGDFSVIVVQDGAFNKRRIVQAIGADFSLDDKPENVHRMNEAENHYSFLLDRPYNQGDRFMLDDVRVRSVQEFFERIKLV